MVDISSVEITAMLGSTGIGFIPASIVGIIICLIMTYFVVKRDKNKMILGLAPISFLMLSLGFNVHPLFILAVTIAYGIYLFTGGVYETNVETNSTV